MDGLVGSEWIATERGLVAAEDLGLPTSAMDILVLRLSDGTRVRCTDSRMFFTKARGWVRAADLVEKDRVQRAFAYVPRTRCSDALPRAARAIASQPSMDLPIVWDDQLAYYLGWLVGDGHFRDSGAVTIYGSAAEISDLMPEHQRLLARWAGFKPKPSVQTNGTVQLRLMRRQFVDFLLSLGVVQAKSADKVVPRAILTAPEEAVTAFLRGLFDADGCVVNDLKKGTRYVGLGSRSEELLLQVHALLASLGMASRVYKTGIKKDSFRYTRKDGSTATYSSSGPCFDLRITAASLRDFAVLIDFGLQYKQRKLLDVVDDHGFYNVGISASVRSRMREPGSVVRPSASTLHPSGLLGFPSWPSPVTTA